MLCMNCSLNCDVVAVRQCSIVGVRRRKIHCHQLLNLDQNRISYSPLWLLATLHRQQCIQKDIPFIPFQTFSIGFYLNFSLNKLSDFISLIVCDSFIHSLITLYTNVFLHILGFVHTSNNKNPCWPRGQSRKNL